MLDDLPTDEKIRGIGNELLQKVTGNSMDGVSKQHGRLKKNGSRKNAEQTAEIFVHIMS